MAHGPVSQLRPASGTVKVFTPDTRGAAKAIQDLAPIDRVSEEEGYLVVKAEQEQTPEMVRRLVASDVDVLGVVPAAKQGLEEIFLELTGTSSREEAS